MTALRTKLLDRPRDLAARRWFVQAHRWAGIALALYIALMGLSGTALVFRHEIEHAQQGTLRHVEGQGTALAPATAYGALKAALPQAHVNRLEVPRESGTAFVADVRLDGQPRTVFLHPVSGQVLGMTEPGRGLLPWLVSLHHNLLNGKTGRLWQGFGAFALLAMTLTGIVVWWPGRKLARKQATRIERRKGWPRTNWDLHHAVGIWSALFLIPMCLTAVKFTWPQEYRAVIATAFAFAPEPRKVSIQPPAERAPLGMLLAAADAANPGHELVSVLFPAKPNEPVRVVQALPGSTDKQRFSQLHLDPYSGRVVRADLDSQRRAGDRLFALATKVHFGQWGGLPVKLLWVVCGLTPVLLAFTGLLMYWNRALARRWRQLTSAARAGGDTARWSPAER